jgi:transcriptional regulator with XRE-family HTH domain
MTNDHEHHDIDTIAAGEVRAWMARRGVSQVELAKIVGIAQNSLSRRLTGHTPFLLSELNLIARAFGVRLSVLTGESSPNETELRNVSPISGGSDHPPLRSRRGRRTSAYMHAVCDAPRTDVFTVRYNRSHLPVTGEATHIRRAA